MSNKLLDAVIANLNIKNDAQLSRILEIAPGNLSKIRHGHLKVGATLILRIHELTDYKMSVKEIKGLIGDKS